MKRLIIPTVIAFGVACAAQAQASAVETYTVDMSGGYAVVGFVGTTPEDFAIAKREAAAWEAQRQLTLKPQSMKAVAIDESQGVALSPTDLRNAIVAAAQSKPH
ncbi:hypothetical protein ISN76_13735 [Dyella halodurans]|uniref:DUF1318 domain-containing protein n=1 Tax=Dyella halodurans TaxID=1920171 RepID=A0ABV9C4V9_9GAMM|nr:hypothetical protein [Dyella halodurans]